MENAQKTLLRLIKKAHCRRDNLMRCFDKWFDLTYNNKNYLPFSRVERKQIIMEKESDTLSRDSISKSSMAAGSWRK